MQRRALVAFKLTEERAQFTAGIRSCLKRALALIKNMKTMDCVESPGDNKNEQERDRGVERSTQCGGCSWSLNAKSTCVFSKLESSIPRVLLRSGMYQVSINIIFATRE